ncbi:MAG: PDZ domain-containing protein [Opitutae bacterium]|jgi:serine protease Do|nr:PDZ domain-containing protein [Opitutae bacterium]MDA8823948.1 PDZ domain-containing protein [Opitutales bacterium]
MKLNNYQFILISLTFIHTFLLAESKVSSSLPLAQAVENVYPAIVRIEVVSEQGSGGRMMKSRSTGSGVIVSKDGQVVTNHHVAGKATRITCRLHDGEEVLADLLGADPMTDLAVLILRMKDRAPDSRPLTIANFGNSDQVEIGDVCFAMGSPAGLSQSVTRGIISNVALISPNSGSFRLDGENVGELVRWLGHDAIIFPGNSGGPLVDEKGFIIGINEVGIGSLGGAIPSNLARSVSKELAENGFISRCWTGLECQPVLDPNQNGLLVAGIIGGSPANDAGFKPGDIIKMYDGKKVSARIAEDLPIFNQLSYGMKVGKKVKINGLRNSKKISWVLTTAKRESAFAKERELKSWAITIRDFTLMSSLEARRSTKEGAQIHSVGRGGPSNSAKPSLVRGDIITKINGEAVRDIKDLIRLSKKITEGKKEPVSTLVTFERDMAKLLTVVKIGPEAEENRPVQAWKPWLGVSTQVLTRELSEALKMPKATRGVRIAQVYPRTPAQKAGMLAGDILFRIDGQIIQAYRTEDAEVFGNMIKEYKPGSLALFSGMREGKKLDLNVTLEKRPDPSNELPDYEEETFEFTVRELSFGDRVSKRLKEKEPGLIVENVEPAGWASLAGLRQGDLVLQINGESMSEVELFEKKMDQWIIEKEKRIIFFVKRGIHTLFLELEPDWDNT